MLLELADRGQQTGEASTSRLCLVFLALATTDLGAFFQFTAIVIVRVSALALILTLVAASAF